MQTRERTGAECGVWLEIILIEVVRSVFFCFFCLSHRQPLRCDTQVCVLYISLLLFVAILVLCPLIVCLPSLLLLPLLCCNLLLFLLTHLPHDSAACTRWLPPSSLLLLLSFSLVSLSVTPATAAAAAAAAVEPPAHSRLFSVTAQTAVCMLVCV